MRKFRFVGDPSNYGWDEPPVCGKIYDGTHKGYCVEEDFESKPIQEWLKNEGGNDWQEITEQVTESKPLHKDTDLGYFAGLFLQGLISANQYPDIDNCISKAKELIKQLNNETDRH